MTVILWIFAAIGLVAVLGVLGLTAVSYRGRPTVGGGL